MAKTFRGGVHPDDMKAMSRECAIEVFPAPERVCILMSQHIGAPCKPCVEKGQRVRTGERVGEPQGFVSAPVHASVTGTVSEIGEALHPVSGLPCPAVSIEREGDDEWVEGAGVETDPGELDGAEIRTRILEAGLVGLGGAAFPTHVKLSPPAEKPVDQVILNAAECEPYLTCDYRLMMERAEAVIDGFRMVMKVLGVSKGLVGIEANKPDAAEKLREAIGDAGDIAVEACEVKYPQGAEAQLMSALLGREVPSGGGLPMDVGCVVQNVATVYAVHEAVRWGRPLVQRVCTVTGPGVEKSANYVIRTGTPVASLLEAARLRPEARKLILGGPMMGLAQRTADIYTMKSTGGILVLTDENVFEGGPCLRCGNCVRHCPCGLAAALISRAVEAEDFDACLELNVLECKQCGTCTYVCPANRPLMHQIKTALDVLKRRKAEADAKRREEEAKKQAEEAAAAT